jgi:hypothetical protein
MGPITSLATLNSRIAELESQREAQKEAIREDFHGLLESLRPINLIKGLFRSVKESPDMKSDILHAAVGLGTGFLTNKILLGKLHGPLKTILGGLIQTGIAKAAVSYPGEIQAKGFSMLAKFLERLKIKSSVEKQHEHAGAVL